MSIGKNINRCMAIGLAVFGSLIMVSGAHAGILFASGDYDNSSPGTSATVLSPRQFPSGPFFSGVTLFEPKTVTYGPDGPLGNIYVLEGSQPGEDDSSAQEFVYEYSPTGVFQGVFVANRDYGAADSDSGEAKWMAFGPDGNLYVAIIEMDSGVEDAVLRFDGQTGAFMDIFVDADDDGPDVDFDEPTYILFDPAGNLYVAVEDGVLRFDSTGTFLDETIDGGAYDESRGMAWNAGELFVSTSDNDTILVVDFNPDGSPDTVTEFASGLNEPSDIAFGPDGFLYVINGDEPESVVRLNPTTGAFVDEYSDLSSQNDRYRDPFGFVFYFDTIEVPVMSPWAMALLALGLLSLAGFVIVRTRRAA